MDNLLVEFLQAFKELEQLCNDIYKDRCGVSIYINEMQSVHSNIYGIPSWENDLQTLKHLRHIRNKLAHELDFDGTDNIFVSDIEFLNNFHRRILNCTDPLSLLHQNKNISIQQSNKRSCNYLPQSPDNYKKENLIQRIFGHWFHRHNC